MNFKNIFLLLFISLLLFGTVCAQKNVNDFQVGESYKHAYDGNQYSLYLNEKQDSGITIYKYLAGDVDDDNDAYDNLIHDEGRDYLTSDDDFKIDKNSDNTANFTDYDHAEHGVVEVVSIDGEDFVVVFWAKDTSNTNNSDLISLLNEFNKDNNVKAVAF
ncbi:hypothetical protein [Methanobrevibacter sp.]|uniref:hypothetical protein n=1 Tax=Methanobrevibacter sp. TaxID=66852 RepID=UPI0025E92ED7|nr:hypothetical protein [Methanobrevibacter sp.]MBQ6512470.1 hypothetical protein [Methanobrevibacter sp.]